MKELNAEMSQGIEEYNKLVKLYNHKASKRYKSARKLKAIGREVRRAFR